MMITADCVRGKGYVAIGCASRSACGPIAVRAKTNPVWGRDGGPFGILACGPAMPTVLLSCIVADFLGLFITVYQLHHLFQPACILIREQLCYSEGLFGYSEGATNLQIGAHGRQWNVQSSSILKYPNKLMSNCPHVAHSNQNHIACVDGQYVHPSQCNLDL